MLISKHDIGAAMRALGLADKPVCLHSSLKSFGSVVGGAETIIDGILEQGCTLMVPSFTSFETPAPPGRRVARNGWDYSVLDPREVSTVPIYKRETTQIDPDMGLIPETVVKMSERSRGLHPLNSFSAVGKLSEDLIRDQQSLNVYAPLKRLAESSGFSILMGVDFTSLTMIHLAEQLSGRNLFRRWAKDGSGNIIEVEVGGCSDGFQKLAPFVSDLDRTTVVGSSQWIALPVQSSLTRLSEVIRNNPVITHCGNEECGRCNAAVLGGPVLD